MPSRQHAVYVISVAAELAGMHPQTLRIYERKGLLEPARTAGGNRRYSEDDIDRLRHIAELAGGGMNLAGIRRVLQLEDEVRTCAPQLEEMVGRGPRCAGRSAARHAPRRDLVPLRQSIAIYRPAAATQGLTVAGPGSLVSGGSGTLTAPGVAPARVRGPATAAGALFATRPADSGDEEEEAEAQAEATRRRSAR